MLVQIHHFIVETILAEVVQRIIGQLERLIMSHEQFLKNRLMVVHQELACLQIDDEALLCLPEGVLQAGNKDQLFKQLLTALAEEQIPAMDLNQALLQVLLEVLEQIRVE